MTDGPSRTSYRWADLGFLLLFAAFGGLGVRLFFLQHVRSAEGQEALNRQSTATEDVPAPRGRIVTADGVTLAESVRVPSIYCVPSHVPEPAALARTLGGILGLQPDDLREKLTGRRAFAWLKRRVSTHEARQVLDLKLPCLGIRSEWKRFYPQHRLASHVVGFVGPDDHGQEGVELAQEPRLAGIPGLRRYFRDALQQRIAPEDVEEKPEIPGANCVLTIDASLQLFTERALDDAVREWKPNSAVAIVIDPRTGKLLALACRPDFDPNFYGQATADERRNRALTDPFEPGSTFKTFVVSSILDRRLLGPTDRIFCENGIYHIGRRTLHDHHPYGWLTLVEVIAKSSNIGMAKLGLMLQGAGLSELVHRYGFGQETGLGLPGESAGRVTSLARWSNYTSTSVPMGHEIAVTPIQLVTAYAAVANRGTLWRPTVIARVQEENGRQWEVPAPQVVRQGIVRKEALEQLVAMLMDVVEEGTGTKAKIAGYTMAGKTGTAQKVAHGVYCHDRFNSSFVGFAPAGDPRVLAMVVLDEPKGAYYGGTVAAPAVASIVSQALRYLEVPPDRPEELEEGAGKPGKPKAKPVAQGPVPR